jgi:hypothetical protein
MLGSFAGARRISVRALLFLFNDLTFLRTPRKSLKFLPSLFKHPTTRSTDNLLNAVRACSNSGIENVPSVCASETIQERAPSADEARNYQLDVNKGVLRSALAFKGTEKKGTELLVPLIAPRNSDRRTDTFGYLWSIRASQR